MPNPSRIPVDFQADTMADLVKFSEKRFNQAAFDKWAAHSTERSRLLRNAFLGSIRWPKSLGRPSGSLASGFSFDLTNHLENEPTDPGGGAGKPDATDVELPPPSAWDAPDDDKHYRVNYFGYYIPINRYNRYNTLMLKIVGSWDNPTKFARFLLPNPLGRWFWSVDGLPIFLDEMTVAQHFLTAGAPWVVKA